MGSGPVGVFDMRGRLFLWVGSTMDSVSSLLLRSPWHSGLKAELELPRRWLIDLEGVTRTKRGTGGEAQLGLVWELTGVAVGSSGVAVVESALEE